jgi:hypothetical protein
MVLLPWSFAISIFPEYFFLYTALLEPRVANHKVCNIEGLGASPPRGGFTPSTPLKLSFCCTSQRLVDILRGRIPRKINVLNRF